MHSKHSLVVGALVAMCVAEGRGSRAADGPYSHRASPDLAEVVTATFVGTPGSEWLSAGAFLASNAVLLCGVSLDAEIVLGGVKARVLGRDAPPLAPFTEFRKLGERVVEVVKFPQPDGADLTARGEPEQSLDISLDERPPPAVTKEVRWPPAGMHPSLQWCRLERRKDAEKEEAFAKLIWSQPEATGFLGVFSPDLREVRVLRRLPRGAGSITAAAVAPDGSVYIAGGATERIAGLCEDVARFSYDEDGGAAASKPGQPLVYVARLNADLASVSWVRVVVGPSHPPRLCLLRNGEVALRTLRVFYFAPDGSLRGSPANPDWVGQSASVNPLDGGFVKAGSWLVKCLGGPYKTPYLYGYDRDGRQTLELFSWHGYMVSMGSLHLEADASIVATIHDDAGNLLLFGWTHGGNTALLRYPWDIERYWPNALGYFGISPGYVLKLSPDLRLIGSTVWLSAAAVNAPGYGVDGSVAWSGLAGRIERLPNALSDVSHGRCLVVTEPDLSAYRFFSGMPGCGERVVVGSGGKQPAGWAIATGILKGKPMLLFLSGAVAEDVVDGRVHRTPLKSAAQPAYAGGLLDGYALLLDLSRRPHGAEKFAAAGEPESAPPPRKTVERKEPPVTGGEGQVFTLAAYEGDRYSVKMTFRDPEDAFWPTFYLGNPEPGASFTCGTNRAHAVFALRCARVEQAQGDQSRRVLGTLTRVRTQDYTEADGKVSQREVFEPEMRLVVREMSAWRLEERVTELASRTIVSSVAASTVQGTLHAGRRAIPLRDALCETRFSVPERPAWEQPVPARDSDMLASEKRAARGLLPDAATLWIRFALRGEALGLTPPLAEQDLRVCVECSAYSEDKGARPEAFNPPVMQAAEDGLPQD